MIHFITHFDETYWAQGMAMIDSLFAKVSDPIKITILWIGKGGIFDHELIRYPAVNVINISWFEEYGDDRLIEARENRSWKSFCWTLEPAIVNYCLKPKRKDGTIIVYCDADMWWTADPIPTIRSVMERADVALSPHWFPPGQESRERTVGRFNFGVSVMRACDLTRRIVGEWLDQTLAKCDENNAGDQKYLDDWPAKMGDRLAELPRGFNFGPWQLVEVYTPLRSDPPMIEGKEPLISAHMHEFRRGVGNNQMELKGEVWNRTNYHIPRLNLFSIYFPYEAALSKFL